MFESIAELAEINPPLRSRTPDRLDAPISFIPMGDVSESGQWLTRQTRPLREVKSGFTPFQEGDVLFAKITPCMENGKGAHAVGLENGVGYGSTEFHVLRAKADNSPRYIFHLSQSSSLRLKAEASMIGSAGQKRVPSDFFRKHRVFAPDRAEQRVVARILDTLDTQIQKTQALIAKLEKVKEGLLHDLLTRGIDENGRLRPSPEQAPELYKESPLGLIPREWSTSSVGQEFEIQLGKMLDAERNSGEVKPYLGNKSVQWGVINISEVGQVRMTGSDLIKFRLAPGDLLVCEGGEVGRAALWEGQMDECYYQKALHRLRPKNKLSSKFMLQVLFLWGRRNTLSDYASQTSIAHLPKEKLEIVLVSVPCKHEQESICSALLSHESILEAEVKALFEMRKIKSGLMDDLLTGRVRVIPLLDQAQATTPA